MVLRPWRDGDLGCVGEASRDPEIPNGTTVPPDFTEVEGIAFVSARGRGLASRAVRVLVRWALVDVGLARIEAFVEPSNTASMRVLESAGFQREGYLRSYLAIGDGQADAHIYSLLATDLA